MAQKGYTTATDFADYLVKKKNYLLEKAYAISSKLVNYAERKKVRLDQLSWMKLINLSKNLKLII